MKWATTILVAAVAGLMALGMVILYSASMAQTGPRYLLMQMAWGGLGLLACMAATVVDYRRLQTFAWPLLAVTLLLLILVLIPGIGVERNGARRWFNLGPMHFQPSELAKVGLIVALAAYGARFQARMHELKRGLLIPGIVLAVALGLIFREPDFGTTLLLAAVSVMVLLVAGADWRYLVPPALAGAALFALAVFNDPVRMKRIMAFLHPDEHKADAGFQAYHAMLALGSGGTTGLGLGNGRQKLGFVPEHHTDFIFSIVGEELGVAATLAVVVAFMAIVACGLFISWRSGNRFGQLLGCGLTFLIGLQAFINIGVVTSALPNKGLPLPFMSYGGSSLFVMLGVVGLLLSIASRASESAPAQAPSTVAVSENPFAEAP